MNPRDLKAMFEQMKDGRDSKWHDGYVAGLRRAQELARDPAVSYQRRGSFAEIDLNAFDQAIDAEAAKERT